MGLREWADRLLGAAAERQRQMEAEQQRQAQLEADRLAEKERQHQADRESAREAAQVRVSPAIRAFPEHAAELGRAIRGERDQQPEQQREDEPTRHEHELRPPGYKPVPVMGVAGVSYANRRVQPVRTVDDMLADAKRDRAERLAAMSPEEREQRRQHRQQQREAERIRERDR